MVCELAGRSGIGEDGLCLHLGFAWHCPIPSCPLYPFRFLSSPHLSSFAPYPFWLGNALGAAPRDGDPITARGCMDTQGPTAFWQWARLVATPCALSLSCFRCLPLHPPTLGQTFSPYTSLLGSVPVSCLRLSALPGFGRVTQWTSLCGFWVF